MKLDFENLTIGQLRELTKEFLKQNPDFITAEEYLNRTERGEKD